MQERLIDVYQHESIKNFVSKDLTISEMDLIELTPKHSKDTTLHETISVSLADDDVTFLRYRLWAFSVDWDFKDPSGTGTSEQLLFETEL